MLNEGWKPWIAVRYCFVDGFHSQSLNLVDATADVKQRLSQLVSFSNHDGHDRTAANDTTHSPGNQAFEPDADRRLIFVTDLDSSIIDALISTASTHQASALRDTLAKHIALEPFIDVRIHVGSCITLSPS